MRCERGGDRLDGRRRRAAAELARVAADLFAAAAEVRASGQPVARVEASFAGGSVFAVRDGERIVAATSVPDPPAALVLYDLRTVLKSTAPEPPKPRRRPSRAKKKPSEEAMSRRSLLVAGAAAGALAAVLLRRRRDRRRDRVTIGYEDGSSITLDSGAEAERLLAIARPVVEAR